MSLLDEIYHSFIEVVPSPAGERGYRLLNNAAAAKTEALRGHFSPELVELFEQAMNARAEADVYYERRFFAKSVAFGALLMLEIFGEELHTPGNK